MKECTPAIKPENISIIDGLWRGRQGKKSRAWHGEGMRRRNTETGRMKWEENTYPDSAAAGKLIGVKVGRPIV
jgi:hypothetical protein